MNKKPIVSYREYIRSLSVCINSLHQLPSYPNVVDEIFTALLFQATLEYNRICSSLLKENIHEKKEKKNAR